MKIWIARHGQTDLNHARRMQGRTDCPLNKKGISQARQTREKIGGIHFDAVYSSPLKRAQQTGSILGGVDVSELIIDPRLIETDFGKYEKRKYYLMGPAMTAYWAMPKIFPAPPTVETISSMKEKMCLSPVTAASCAHCAATSTRHRTAFTGSGPKTVRPAYTSIRTVSIPF